MVVAPTIGTATGTGTMSAQEGEQEAEGRWLRALPGSEPPAESSQGGESSLAGDTTCF